MKSNLDLIILSALFLSLQCLGAKNFDLSTATGVVRFSATGAPGNFKINGTTENKLAVLSGSMIQDGKLLKVTSTFNLSQLDTGIGLRTRHMKEKYLEVEKFPTATLRVNSIALATEQSSGPVPFQGELEFHGVKKNITGTLKLDPSQDSLSLECDFSINLTDFGIEVPSFAGVTVNNQIPIQVELKNAKAS